MTRDDLKQELARWIAEITEEEPPVLDEGTDLVLDVGLDSLALAELAAKLRVSLKVKLRPGELRNDLRVGSLLDLIQARLTA